MITEEIRSYEVSLWTLQDEFITVLKWSNTEQQGGIFDVKMTLNIDGTEKLTFSIPMYLYTFVEGDRTITVNHSNSYMQRIENPIWYNTRNGNLIANMRKIKVIFNKGNENIEKVFEFIITRVTERHDGEQLNCEVECEGLAFHELGKIGYKISLSSDVFQSKVDKWFAENEDENEETKPIANLQYWNEDKDCLNLPIYDEENPELQWYYDIRMKWDDILRDEKKVYEDSYSSWEYQTDVNGENGHMVPKDTYIAQEKARLIDLDESNLYNLTQNIAEKFGIFCRYEYKHDENYHIISKIIIYYNSFIDENQIIHLTYPYSSSSISRELDGTDLITKMYVNSIDSDTTASGLITIMNSEANKSKEDYILNFDYLYTVGAINEDQYVEIEQYENNMGILNSLLIPLEDKKNKYESELITAQASLTIAERSRDAATEQLTNLNQQIAAVLAKEGNSNGTITATAQTGTLIKGSDKTYLDIKEKGVFFSTLKIYQNYDFGENVGVDQIQNGIPEYDEYNNLIRVNWTNLQTNSSLVYLSYDYSPELYNEHIRQTWTTRLYNDEQNIEKYIQQINNINEQLEILNETIQYYTDIKKQLIQSFNKLMGPALREGNWTPDDYKNCENSYISKLNTNNNLSDGKVSFVWDNQVLAEEQDYQYQANISGEMKSYLCLRIDSTILNSEEFDNLSIIYWNTNYNQLDSNGQPNYKYAKTLNINASCQYAIVEQNNVKYPVIMLTSANNLSNDEITLLKQNCKIGVIHANVDENTGEYTTNVTIIKDHNNISNGDWIVPEKIFYPRIIFNSDSLIINEEKLMINLNKQLLENYIDYYVLVQDGQYCITIKPVSYLKYAKSIHSNFEIYYTVSNASTSIYLDAIQILKENAYPKVSYTIESNVFNTNFIKTSYNNLGKLVYINDTDLKLENVFGYISELNLDLVNPQNDSIEIKNYKTKFEDLFSSIVASTESMQKNSYTFDSISAAFNLDGSVKKDALQKSILKVDLDYAFNNGNLTIDNENGIWCSSDIGVVAISGGGIFTATSKDANDKWIWNTGITPEGINANLITTGQLDTNKITIYAGDQIRLQLNSEGLYAYKSIRDDATILSAMQNELKNLWPFGDITSESQTDYELSLQPGTYIMSGETEETNATLITFTYENGDFVEVALNNSFQLEQPVVSISITYVDDIINVQLEKGSQVSAYKTYTQIKKIRNYFNSSNGLNGNDLDTKQYVVFNKNGLFLVAENGASILRNDELVHLNTATSLERVAVSWDGLTLRNWNGDKTLYADADTGNLTVEGTIKAHNGEFHGAVYANSFQAQNSYIDENSGDNILGNQFIANGRQFGFYDAYGNSIVTFSSNCMNISEHYQINAAGGLLMSTGEVTFTEQTNLSSILNELEGKTNKIDITGIFIGKDNNTQKGKISITSDGVIDINSTNFKVNSGNNASEIFYVGNNDIYLKYYNTSTQENPNWVLESNNMNIIANSFTAKSQETEIKIDDEDEDSLTYINKQYLKIDNSHMGFYRDYLNTDEEEYIQGEALLEIRNDGLYSTDQIILYSGKRAKDISEAAAAISLKEGTFDVWSTNTSNLSSQETGHLVLTDTNFAVAIDSKPVRLKYIYTYIDEQEQVQEVILNVPSDDENYTLKEIRIEQIDGAKVESRLGLASQGAIITADYIELTNNSNGSNGKMAKIIISNGVIQMTGDIYINGRKKY